MWIRAVSTGPTSTSTPQRSAESRPACLPKVDVTRLAPVLALLGPGAERRRRTCWKPARPGPPSRGPRSRAAAPDSVDLSTAAPIDLPVRARGTVLGSPVDRAPTDGLPAAWTKSPGPLGTIADLIALTLSPAADPDAATRRQVRRPRLVRPRRAGPQAAGRRSARRARPVPRRGPLPARSRRIHLARRAAALARGRARKHPGRACRRARPAQLPCSPGSAPDAACGWRSKTCAPPPPIPVELHAPPLTEPPAEQARRPAPVAAAAGYRFVQAALSRPQGARRRSGRGAAARRSRVACPSTFRPSATARPGPMSRATASVAG